MGDPALRQISGVRHAVDGELSHPSYQGIEGMCAVDADIGLVHLAAPITDITPAPLRHRSDLVSWSTCLGLDHGKHDGPTGVTVKEKRIGYLRITQYAGDAVRAQNGGAPPSTGAPARTVGPCHR
jgi:hypothetical protein